MNSDDTVKIRHGPTTASEANEKSPVFSEAFTTSPKTSPSLNPTLYVDPPPATPLDDDTNSSMPAVTTSSSEVYSIKDAYLGMPVTRASQRRSGSKSSNGPTWIGAKIVVATALSAAHHLMSAGRSNTGAEDGEDPKLYTASSAGVATCLNTGLAPQNTSSATVSHPFDSAGTCAHPSDLRSRFDSAHGLPQSPSVVGTLPAPCVSLSPIPGPAASYLLDAAATNPDALDAAATVTATVTTTAAAATDTGSVSQNPTARGPSTLATVARPGTTAGRVMI